MASSSVGSEVFLAVALLLIFTTALLVLRHFLPLRTTPAYLLLPVFLALALPASIIVLVPIDLASSTGSEHGANRGIWLPDRAQLLLWRIAYWLTFVLTWLVLPILGEYADAGHRDPKARVIYSLRSNARYYAIVIVCSIAGLVYFFLTSGFRVTSVKALVMALAYAWGLILAIYLMGHGLIAIPRRLYKNASPAQRLRNLESRAPMVHEKLNESTEQLEQLEAEVLELQKKKNGTAQDMKEWIEDLLDTSDLPTSRVGAHTNRTRSQNVEVVTIGYLADLTRKLKRARHKRIRFDEEWSRLVKDALKTQAIVDAKRSKKLNFEKSNSRSKRFGLLTPYTRYQLHVNIIPALRIFFSGFLGIASICVIWTEIFRPIVPKISIIGLSVMKTPNHSDGTVGFDGQLIAACWLLYMCTAALYSIREVKVWGNRALVRRHTYSESACWYACQVAKLTVPLSYNFITCLPRAVYLETSFYSFLGKPIDLTPLGLGFSRFFPIFILVPVLATSFNLYGKIKSFAGFGVLEENTDDNPAGYGTGTWREGRALIDREVQTSSDAFGLSSRDQSPGPAAGRAPLLPVQGYSSSPSSAPNLGNDNSNFSSSETSSPALNRAGGRRQPTQYRDRRNILDPEDSTGPAGEENFFSDFAHRVKNTFDTAERPAWIPKVNITRPKWMNSNGGGGGSGNNSESSDRADSGGGLGRWLGGRPEDGRVRL